MSHTSSFCSVYPVTLTLQVKDQRSRHKHTRTHSVSHSLAISGHSFSRPLLPLADGKGDEGRGMEDDPTRIRELQHLPNIFGLLFIYLFMFLPFSVLDVERRHSVNPRLGSRAMPQSVYDFYKNSPLSVNICVGKAKHKVAFMLENVGQNM